MSGKNINAPGERAGAIRTLRNIEAFSDLTEKDLVKIAETIVRKKVLRGETLIRNGDSADALYIVLNGKFVVMHDGKPIAEIGSGEPVGELGFFANTKRTADVVAIRGSEVLVLSRKTYEVLTTKLPALTRTILATMARRVSENSKSVPRLQPRPGRLVALVAAAGGKIEPTLISDLEKCLTEERIVPDKSRQATRILHRRDMPDRFAGSSEAIEAWLLQEEAKCDTLISIIEDSESNLDFWRDAVLEQADTIFLVAEKKRARQGPVPLSALEKRIFSQSMSINLNLLIWREHQRDPIRHSENWLKERKVGLHHHLALDSSEDLGRVLRFMQGKALGAVLCGGGAFGTAHLGALKAILDHGIKIDMYGGTSVGAAMAAALAMDLDPAEAMNLCEDIFIKSKAMSRLAVPVHSVIDHKKFDEQMKKHYGDCLIENMRFNFFGVSTSLTTNDMHLLRTGPLWRAVRASSSIPAIFPPVIQENGEVLIDGALVDNVPINVMRDLKAGPNLVLNFARGEPWRVHSDYDKLPGRAETARRMIRRRKSDQRFPSIPSVLSRTMVVTARRLLDETEMGDDVLMEIPTLAKMGFLEWKRGREQFTTAFDAMDRALRSLDETNPVERLRQAAKLLACQQTGKD